MAQREESTEVVVIGAGPAGYVCAIRLAQLGKKVTVIEKENLGGVCLNIGCIPSKALIYAGSLFEKFSHAEEMGITATGVKLDMKKLVGWKETVVKKLTSGVGGLLKAHGCKVVAGTAEFVDPTTLKIVSEKETVLLKFQQCVIATGSRPMKIPGFEVDQENILDSTGALAQMEVPESLLCIGGGYIGLELGTFYAKIGTKVTVVEAAGHLLSGVDPELTRVVAKALEKRKVTVKLNTKVKSCTVTKKGCEVVVENGEKFAVDKVLVTVGRVPNTDQLGLDRIGLRLDSKGFISVDGARKTTLPHIYAIGDVAGQPLLAHKGSKEGIVAAEAIAGLKTVYDVVAMPAVIFTDPEVATVGLTEAEARSKGYEVKVGQFPFAANGRALSVSESDGFVKMVGDARTGKLLGVHIVGVEASNLIAEAALALEMGAQVEDIALTVHAHPTLPETLMEAAEATLGHAIHIFQKRPASNHAPQAHAGV